MTQVLAETNPFFKAVKIERAQRGILSKGNEKRQHKVEDVIALGLATNISLVREGKRHKMWQEYIVNVRIHEIGYWFHISINSG